MFMDIIAEPYHSHKIVEIRLRDRDTGMVSQNTLWYSEFADFACDTMLRMLKGYFRFGRVRIIKEDELLYGESDR